MDIQEMNVELLTRLAQWLETDAPHVAGIVQFDMIAFIEPYGCGTACCIAGSALQFHRAEIGLLPLNDSDEINGCPERRAAIVLGLRRDVAYGLFFGNNIGTTHIGYVPLDIIDAAHAARCIRKLMATGTVDWTGTREA